MKRTMTLLGIVCVLALAIAMIGCSSSSQQTSSSSTVASGTSSQTATRTVAAADGTVVTIPESVTKVAPTIGALAEITMIDSGGQPVISAASTQQITDLFKTFFPLYDKGNPNNYSATSIEDLVASGTQVVYGASSTLSDDQKSQMAAAGIAFVPIDKVSTVDQLCDATTLIGQILGGDAVGRASTFTAYWKQQLADAKTATANVTTKQTIMECMYSGSKFTTVNSSDITNEYFTAANLTNLTADMQQQSGGGNAGITIDEETIAKLNPDWILTNSIDGKNAIMNDTALAQVTAVKQGHVLVSPQGAYLWNVRSGEGALLPMWLVYNIYPEAAGSYDPATATKQFFAQFYNYQLSDDQVTTILSGGSVAAVR